MREVEVLVKGRQEAVEAQEEDAGEITTVADAQGKRQAVDEETLNQLQSRLGWGLTVNSTGKEKGRIVIEFRTEGEKQELLRKLLSIEV